MRQEPSNDAAPSTAAIAGHPIHPMLVPMPIGLFVGALASDLGYLLSGDRFWARASRWLLAGGVVTGAGAAAVGAVDFVTIPRARRPEGWIHVGGNALALVLGLVSLRARLGNAERAALPAGLFVTALIGAILSVTGWMGGELAYRYRIGVAPPPDEVMS